MTTRPGFLAGWRARRGVTHSRYAVSVGYGGLFDRVILTRKELGHHGAIFGAPGSGKTTTLALLAQGHSNYGPCIILDGKGSLSLQSAVHAAGGLVWTIGGPLKLDLLDPDPTVLAEQMTEAARHEGPSEVYSEAAARTIQWIGHLLAWQGQRPTLNAVEALLVPDTLIKELEPFKARGRVGLWLAALEDLAEVELSGTRSALLRTTRLIDSAAGQSLGAGAEAIRFEDVMQGKTTLLVSLDARRYPGLTRILGGWALLALQRACLATAKGMRALLVVDEVATLGRQARHIEPLLALARDMHVGVVVAAHGPTQLDSAMHGLASMVLQETAWQIVLRQGDSYDADRLSMLFPLDPTQRVTLGTHATGTPSLTRDDLRSMAVGECAYWVSAVDASRPRWGRARIAMPTFVELPVRLALPAPKGAEAVAEEAEAAAAVGKPQITEEVEDRSVVYRHVRVVVGYRTWTGNFDADGYPRVWLPWLRRYVQAHRQVCEWEHGPIPKGWTVDHVCGLKACMDHLEAVTRAENLRRRHARERGELPTGHGVGVAA